MKDKNTFYITTPIYYVNGKPHVGHAYTTITADVLARFYRARGKNVRFLTGNDEHGDKIAEIAQKEGVEPQVFVDKKAEEFQALWKALNISHDTFSRTTSEKHKKSVQVFMQALYDQGDIYEGEYEGLYCVGCEKFLTERDLVDGKCPDHNREPQHLKEKNYFFRLSKYLPAVKKAIESGELVVEPAARRNEVLSLLEMGLEDFSVSRESVEWGIPLPWDESQVSYVWVEALQNYISDIAYGVDQKTFESYWPADVHLMAKEILKFHAIFWPAMLLAADVPLPKKIFAHGFFTVNGQKMSKTLGNVIDPHEMVEQFGADAARYLLLSQFPYDQDGNIEKDRFVEKYNADLANTIGNLAARTAQMVEKFVGGKVKPVNDIWKYDVAAIDAKVENLDLFGALNDILAIAQAGNQYIDEQKPWEQAKQGGDVEATLANLVGLLLDLGALLTPFIPEAGEKITQTFTQKTITKTEPLFPRL